MSESIQDLRKMIPQCKDNDKKYNQALVMALAVDYIQYVIFFRMSKNDP